MLCQKIEYPTHPYDVFTHKKLRVPAADTELDAQVITYAAWRWLWHCRVLRDPFRNICRFFRYWTKKKPNSLSLTLTVPARATGLDMEGYLHLLVKISGMGVCLTRITRSDTLRPVGMSRHIHQVVFH